MNRRFGFLCLASCLQTHEGAGAGEQSGKGVDWPSQGELLMGLFSLDGSSSSNVSPLSTAQPALDRDTFASRSELRIDHLIYGSVSDERSLMLQMRHPHL